MTDESERLREKGRCIRIGRMFEREAIVKWLRNRWAAGPTSLETYMADLIERGEHLDEAP